MKNIFKSIVLVGLAVATLASCTEEDNTINQVFDGVSSGAVLRGIPDPGNNNNIPVGVEDSQFSQLLEYQDAQGGDLLDRVEVYVTYTDGSPDEGDSTGATMEEVLARTVTAAEFFEGPFGLPRYNLVITRAEFFSLVGLPNDLNAIFGGDTFRTRLVLYLTDGRVFDPSNATGVISAGFFNSPFTYTTPVICPVEEEFFTGDYLTEQITPGIYGGNLINPGATGSGFVTELFNRDTAVNADGDGITAEAADGEGLSITQRAFDGVYLANLGINQPPNTFIIDFICNEVTFPSQSTNLTCGGGITVGPPTGPNGVYDFQDDTTFDLNYTDDETPDCAFGATQATLRFTKQ